MKIVKKLLKPFIVVAIFAAVFLAVFMFIMYTKDTITAKKVVVFGFPLMIVIFLIVAFTRGKVEKLINKKDQ